MTSICSLKTQSVALDYKLFGANRVCDLDRRIIRSKFASVDELIDGLAHTATHTHIQTWFDKSFSRGFIDPNINSEEAVSDRKRILNEYYVWLLAPSVCVCIESQTIVLC